MEIYPAVDLYEGKVVRLERGDYSKCKVYSESPGEIVKRWADEGARWVHVVDLEGAKTGEIKNRAALKEILKEKRVSIQFGGGVRRQADIQELLQAGVQRVILGTRALESHFVQEALLSNPWRSIGLSLDIRGEKIQTEGWLKEGEKTIDELLDEFAGYPACLVMTDIERDGTLTGLNLERLKKWVSQSRLPVIISGGVSSLEDIRALVSLKLPNLTGVIIGKALYENKVNLRWAIEEAEKGEKK